MPAHVASAARRALVALTIAFGSVAGPARGATTEPVLRSVAEIRAIAAWDVRGTRPLELEGTLTLVDPDRRLIVVQSGDDALGLYVDLEARMLATLAPGRKVRVTAGNCWPALAAVPDFPARPSGRELLRSFEAPAKWKTNYLARVRGYVHPPATGVYHFRIASDDTSELWLGTSDNPQSARPIAAVSIWTKAREWTHLPGQQSAGIHLETGRRYYIEAVHEQRWRDDHLSVAWEGPGVPPQIISGTHLSPWVDGGERAAARGHVLREHWLDRSMESAAALMSPRTVESILDTARGAVHDLGPSALPTPRQAQAGESAQPHENFRWTELEGVVDFVARRGATLVLELAAGGKRTRAIVSGWEREPPPRLSGRRVRLSGTAELGRNENGECVLGTLWVPAPTTIPIVETGPPIANARLSSIAELSSSDPQFGRNRLVKLRGRVAQSQPGRMTVSDAGSFYGYVSADGENWRPFGPPVEIPMGEAVEIGLMVTSRSTENVATAVFEEVRGLPAAPIQSAIGGPTRAGELRLENGRLTLRGSGHDIWISPDQFYFAHTKLAGAGEIVARIAQFDAADTWAKAGLMIRESLAPDAQFVDLVQTGANGCALQWRKAAEGSAPLSVNDATLRPPHWLKLARRFNTIEVTGERLETISAEARVEIVGYVVHENGRPAIADASCRVLTAEDERPGAMQLRPLIEIARALGPTGNMDRYDLFKVKGVVTFYGEVAGRRYMAVQDHSGGALVTGNLRPRIPSMRAGHYVEVHSNPGWSAPSPHLPADNVFLLGSAAFPTPLRHPSEFALPRRGEGTWIEIEGIVRAASSTGTLTVKDKGELFSVAIGGTTGDRLRELVDALARIRGVITYPSKSERLLLVPSLEHFELVERPATEPLARPVARIAELAPEKLLNQSLHRVNIAGTVTHCGPSHCYLQDDSGAARVELGAPIPLEVGEHVEATGFPDLAEDDSPVLTHALVRPKGRGADVAPTAVTAAALVNGKVGARLVRLTAIFSRQRAGDGDRVMELQLDQRILGASLSGASDDFPSIPPGSVIQLTGVAVPDPTPPDWMKASAGNGAILPVRLLVRSAKDVVVLQKPRWWTVKRTLLGTSVAGCVLFVGVIWIQLLRRRVAQRTAELDAAMEKLKRETQTAATLAERNRLAGEIHDSLEQGFSGLILQLDTTAKFGSCPPEVRSGLAMARNMVAFSRNEVRHAVWDLQSPVLDNADLSSAMRKIAAQLAPETPHTTVRVEGAMRPLSSAVEHHLLRIAQEAITNTVKHAGARHLDIVLTYSSDEVRLAISDDGQGFEPDAVLTGQLGHFGLRSLRGRASKIRGTLEISSHPGRGTKIEVVVPIAASMTI